MDDEQHTFANAPPLEREIVTVLLTWPSTWADSRLEHTTALREEAIQRLLNAGMLEARVGFTLIFTPSPSRSGSSTQEPETVNLTFRVSGDGWPIRLQELLPQHTPPHWWDEKTLRGSFQLRGSGLSTLRLSLNGEQAKADLRSGDPLIGEPTLDWLRYWRHHPIVEPDFSVTANPQGDVAINDVFHVHLAKTLGATAVVSPLSLPQVTEAAADDGGKQPAPNANEWPPDGGALYNAAQVAMQNAQNDPYSSEWRLPDNLLSDPQLRIALYTRFENDLTAWLNGNHNPLVWDKDDWEQWAEDAAVLTTLAEINGLESEQLSQLHYSAVYPGRGLSDDLIVGARAVVGALKAKARAELAQRQTPTHSPADHTADRSAVVAGKTPDGESSTQAPNAEASVQSRVGNRTMKADWQSVERVPAFERFSNFSYFTEIAQELLHWPGGLPLPRDDGFEGNPYFSESDITELLTEVRRYCSEFSSQQWLTNPDPSVLLIEMELALERRKKAEASGEGGKVDGGASSTPAQTSEAITNDETQKPLQEAQILAYRAAEYARMKTRNEKLKPRQVWEFWTDPDRGLANEDRDDFPELVGYIPGGYSTFAPQLSRATNHPSIDTVCYDRVKQKETGGSVVRSKDI